MIVWLIDDSEGHHEAAAASCARCGVDFLGFLDPGSAIAAMLAAAPVDRPDVLLMDFYIGDERGDRATRAWREAEPVGYRARIVGYSSMRDASEAIVAAGGDLVLRKRIVGGVHPELVAWLQQAV